MAKLDPALMPTDQTNEMERAARALKKIRKLLASDEYKLPIDWQKWISKQVASDYETLGAMIELRPYQKAAIAALYDHLRNHDDNPCIVVPTGGGKTPIMAQICRDAVLQFESRVLILAHVKELLEQSYSKLREMCPEFKAGLYSAGLKRRDTDNPVVVAGIQSAYNKACDFGRVELVLVDEAHLISAEDDSGMYRSFLADLKGLNPHLRVCGLTATPYRLKSGLICAPENMLNRVCYEIGVRELIDGGYLCPLVSRRGENEASMAGVPHKGGEFASHEMQGKFLDIVESAVTEVVKETSERKAVLLFAAGIKHGERITELLRKAQCDAEMVTGDTSPSDRERLIREFRNGTLKYLVNVNVLTTGFDAPNVDCVGLLRSTESPGLYYQMCGRGLRLHKSKRNCMVLDFGGNIRRHGPVDKITPASVSSGEAPAPTKTCPECGIEVALGVRFCGACGFMFTEEHKPQHDEKPETQAGVLSTEIIFTEHVVRDVSYAVHKKKGADEDAPRTLRVEYQVGVNTWISEWICFEHVGFARLNAEKWWRKRSNDPVPANSSEAKVLCNIGRIKPTLNITTRLDGKYDRVVGHVLGEMPDCGPIPQHDGFFPLKATCPKCGSLEGKLRQNAMHHAAHCLHCNTFCYFAKHEETFGYTIEPEDEPDERELTFEEEAKLPQDYAEEDVPF